MENKIIGQGITFDDVSLVPAYSDFIPREADTSTHVTRSICLKRNVLSQRLVSGLAFMVNGLSVLRLPWISPCYSKRFLFFNQTKKGAV